MPCHSKPIPGGHPAVRIESTTPPQAPPGFSNNHHFKIVFEFNHGALYEHLYVRSARVNQNCALASSSCSDNVLHQRCLLLMAGTATD
jgi:hypothetical protein